MTKRKVVEEQEEPVKNWQLEATQKQVDQHEKLIGNFDSKLDTIINLLQTRPTVEQVDAKLEVVKLQFKSDLKNEIDKQDLKYKPIVTNNKILFVALLTSGVGLMGSLILLVVGVFSK